MVGIPHSLYQYPNQNICWRHHQFLSPMNFATPPLTPQTTVKPFVPATPPVLRNVEQYQQPTLGSQLYPVLAPTPSGGFMPVTSAGVQRPGMGPTQPSSPTQPAQVQPAISPASPPPTLFNETSEALGGSRANPGKKREIEDNSRPCLPSLTVGTSPKMPLKACSALPVFGKCDWDECNFWLATLKRIIKTRQSVR
ncbi:hypothetical protein RHSIM_RhsimUnG0246200 [Rhododendron simsii]|uniref:Uncharacterized protein n=1 Tax=Rhododendron simsii TaxID=118357 RepID=A0A834FT15_RHOSS|nr:hypothetical protein RHSIM_RhsimUnG0246200 [Rhododendron simsii]